MDIQSGRWGSQVPERRQFRRATLGRPARLWLDIGWQQVICEDVSPGGIGLTVFSPVLSELVDSRTDTSQPLRVTLQLPDGDVELSGRLVHRSTDRIGIAFGHLSSDTWSRIGQLLD